MVPLGDHYNCLKFSPTIFSKLCSLVKKVLQYALFVQFLQKKPVCVCTLLVDTAASTAAVLLHYLLRRAQMISLNSEMEDLSLAFRLR